MNGPCNAFDRIRQEEHPGALASTLGGACSRDGVSVGFKTMWGVEGLVLKIGSTSLKCSF